VAHGFADLADHVLAELWQHGWMPQDLRCVFDKHLAQKTARVGATAVAGQLRVYPDAKLSDLWRAQRSAVTETALAEDLRALLRDTADDVLPARWATVLEVLDLLFNLPIIPVVQPPPGASRVETALSGTAEGTRVYEKVRALLAKAESTDSDAEAEAFTAKAQQLITRYSIDEARLDAEKDRKRDAAALRVPIERPYEGPKAELLNHIADANQCRTVYSEAMGFSTVMGESSTLRSVELLFNSLLVQAQAALAREGSRQDAAGRSRTRSFRQSFLAAFALRIGERLDESAEAMARAAGAEAGTDLVPLLELRRDAADAKTEELFPDLRLRPSTRISNYEGHIAGRAAADRARLQGAEEISRP
jgi:hypothetical protein